MAGGSMSFNDDDWYLMDTATGAVLEDHGPSWTARKNQAGKEWMRGLSAKYFAANLAKAKELGTAIHIEGTTFCSVGVNMGLRKVWIFKDGATLFLTRNQASSLIFALERGIEQLDMAEFRESMSAESLVRVVCIPSRKGGAA
jgi:hypothetical protein